eukprot:CAMPEP_0179025564 /NCGR_PEP_ID=MMETSP0796-20121207/8052_1 /TAXON_ID=73915 /ORGANISM="Pyrodinium bahamense, Strain pbaha01" /LENGTH=144 /DNA_ID=CAMNT_0020721593 /DNA_START=52 /DNA_END=483 /DNA_ORIENTATION=-
MPLNEDEVEMHPVEAKAMLLELPSSDASAEEWAGVFPISGLPPLPKVGPEYYWEASVGSFIVVVLSTLLLGSAIALARSGLKDREIRILAVLLIVLWAAIALVCDMYILCGEAGKIRRSSNTCYPIPEEVAVRLQETSHWDLQW